MSNESQPLSGAAQPAPAQAQMKTDERNMFPLGANRFNVIVQELREIAVYVQSKGMGNIPQKLCAIADKLAAPEEAPSVAERELLAKLAHEDFSVRPAAPVAVPAGPMSDEQIEYMVRRFLQWRLPENFTPDAGISFKPTFNDNMPFGPMKHNPTGTNLFDYTQAKEMVRHMLEGIPAPPASLPPPQEPTQNEIPEGYVQDKRPRYGWMDSLHFDYHLGQDIQDLLISKSQESCKAAHKCIDTDGHCTAIEVAVFRVTPSSTYWQADSEKVFPCGHSKWDADHNCLTCNQETVKLLNASLAEERIKNTRPAALAGETRQEAPEKAQLSYAERHHGEALLIERGKLVDKYAEEHRQIQKIYCAIFPEDTQAPNTSLGIVRAAESRIAQLREQLNAAWEKQDVLLERAETAEAALTAQQSALMEAIGPEKLATVIQSAYDERPQFVNGLKIELGTEHAKRMGQRVYEQVKEKI